MGLENVAPVPLTDSACPFGFTGAGSGPDGSAGMQRAPIQLPKKTSNCPAHLAFYTSRPQLVAAMVACGCALLSLSASY